MLIPILPKRTLLVPMSLEIRLLTELRFKHGVSVFSLHVISGFVEIANSWDVVFAMLSNYVSFVAHND